MASPQIHASTLNERGGDRGSCPESARLNHYWAPVIYWVLFHISSDFNPHVNIMKLVTIEPVLQMRKLELRELTHLLRIPKLINGSDSIWPWLLSTFLFYYSRGGCSDRVVICIILMLGMYKLSSGRLTYFSKIIHLASGKIGVEIRRLLKISCKPFSEMGLFFF